MLLLELVLLRELPIKATSLTGLRQLKGGDMGIICRLIAVAGGITIGIYGNIEGLNAIVPGMLWGEALMIFLGPMALGTIIASWGIIGLLNRRYKMVVKTDSRPGYHKFSLEDTDVTGTLSIDQIGYSKAEVCAAALKRFDKMRAKLNRMEEAVLDIRNN